MNKLVITPEQLLESNIFDSLGFDKLDEKQKQDMLVQLAESVTNGVLVRIYDALPETERDEWQKMVEAGQNEAAAKFLTDHNLNINELAAQEALVLKTKLISAATSNQ